MSRLVLDLRDHQRNTTDGLRLTNATSTGEVGGYRVESQLRSANSQRGLSIRLTSIDGTVLDLVGPPGVSPDNSKSPVTGALSPQVGYAFRSRRSHMQHEASVRAIEDSIHAGLHCLSEKIHGAPARVRVQCAARGLNHARVMAFMTEHERVRHRSERDLTVEEVDWLLGAGIPAAKVGHWFPTRHFSGAAHVQALAAFRGHGWAREDILTLEAHLCAHKRRLDPTEPAWVNTKTVDAYSRFTPRQGLLAARAGLSPTTVRHMLRQGTFNEAALEMTAALLGDPLDGPPAG